jgi:hypothetical protein
LDINKLELFHVQFTAAVIDLLKKIKKINERNTSLFFEEIRLNKEMILALKTATLPSTILITISSARH